MGGVGELVVALNGSQGHQGDAPPKGGDVGRKGIPQLRAEVGGTTKEAYQGGGQKGCHPLALSFFHTIF